MSEIALRLGPIAIAGHQVVRSAIRWLCADGHVARAGEPIAYCTAGILDAAGGTPFVGETRDLQIAFAPAVPGRVRRAAVAAAGGFLDRLSNYHWLAEETFGHILPTVPPGAADPAVPRLMMLAGRRMTEVAEDRAGLLTGWHDRARGWWGEGTPATLLGLGTCDLTGALRGAAGAFTEFFEAVPGGGQIVAVQDEPLVPSAPVLLEQMTRTAADTAAIMADAAATFAAVSPAPLPADWLFVGALLAGLARCPITETCPIFDRAGLHIAPPAAAVALSLTSELPPTLRHRRLGYAIACHPFRLAQAGAATRAWLGACFIPAPRSIAIIAQDYRRLMGTIKQTTGAEVLVLNGISTQVHEDILHYAGFDAPLGETLLSVRAKACNVMLDTLAAETGMAIVDVDAIVAARGMWAHLPDGIHQSGATQAAVRTEIAAILRARGIW